MNNAGGVNWTPPGLNPGRRGANRQESGALSCRVRGARGGGGSACSPLAEDNPGLVRAVVVGQRIDLADPAVPAEPWGDPIIVYEN